jgi:hypothetical protein
VGWFAERRRYATEGLVLCKRCGNDVDLAELRPPSLVLRLLGAPVLLVLMLRSGAVRGEINALYCQACRRRLNASFLFIAFMVIVFRTIYVLQKFGLAGGQPR